MYFNTLFKSLTLLFLFSLMSITITAQSVIIIPFYKKGENRRNIIEEDPCYRFLETKIKNVFLQKEGYGVIDYLATVKKYELDKLYGKGSQSDLKTALLRAANPDVYIIADIEAGSNGSSHWMYINLTAHFTSTGRTIGAVTIDSGYRSYSNCQDLIGKGLIETDASGLPVAQVLLQQIKTALEGSVNGIPMSIQFTVDEGSMYHYMTKLSDDELLVQKIKNFVKEKSMDQKSNANIRKTIIDFKEVIIPARHPDTKDAYTPSDFALDLYSFLTALSTEEYPDETLGFDMDIAGSTLYFKMN